MDFELIFRKWEESKARMGKKRRPAGGKGVNDFRKDADLQNKLPKDWFENYLPDSSTIEEKAEMNEPPVSKRRDHWQKRPCEDSLDLHGLNREQAVVELHRFISSMRKRGQKKGLIIHGKGNHSPEGSVLGPAARQFLEESRDVGEFGKGKRKDGGSGVSWFILK